jgi:hypothetical protein
MNPFSSKELSATPLGPFKGLFLILIVLPTEMLFRDALGSGFGIDDIPPPGITYAFAPAMCLNGFHPGYPLYVMPSPDLGRHLFFRNSSADFKTILW